MLMKLSKAVVPAASVGAFAIVAITAGVLMIQNAGQSSNAPIVDQHVAVVSSVAHSSSAAVAQPLAVVPRSSVVVKQPATIQGVTVTDPTSTDPASTPADPSTAPVSDPSAIPTTSDGWGPPNQQTNPAIPPLPRSRSAGPTCVGNECPTPTG